MPTDKSQITTWFAFANQSAYGTESASGDTYHRVVLNQQVTFDNIGEPEFQDDSDYDTGSDLADNTWVIKNSSGANLSADLCFQDVGFYLLDALGGYALTDLGFSRYKHVFTPQSMDTSRQLPVRTMLKRYGGLETVLARDMALTNLTFTWGKTGRSAVSAQYSGSGYYAINPASYTEPSLGTKDYLYNQQSRFYVQENDTGTAQVETATAAGTIGASGAGNVEVVITSALITKTLSVAVANNDTAAQVAGKIRDAIGADLTIRRYFTVSGSSTSIILTAVDKAANDSSLNIALDNDTSTGLTPAATSSNTTAGVAPTKQSYSCEVESGSFVIQNPLRDGNRQCDDFLVDDDPTSGAVQSEALVGKRDYMVEFTCRLESGDKMLGWLKDGSELYWKHRVFSSATVGMSLVFEHTKAKVTGASRAVDGDYIVVRGKLKLLSDDGSVPLTTTLINDITDYVP